MLFIYITLMEDFDAIKTSAAMPLFSYASLNRCNLPSAMLGSVTYQQHPVTLRLDCVAELHVQFFDSIKTIQDPVQRSQHFRQYMCSAFLLGKSEEAGYQVTDSGKTRQKLDYLRLLRGWMFNSDSIEGAVLKRWVESRFGLLTINHGGLLSQFTNHAVQKYQQDYAAGLYNTNALESQLDLLYSYCQYELQRQYPQRSHWQLFRGVNGLAKHTQLTKVTNNQQLLLLNNLNSFSHDAQLSETFGDIVLDIQVPSTKILFYPQLLDGVLEGEGEYLVIGGVYQARFKTF